MHLTRSFASPFLWLLGAVAIAAEPAAPAADRPMNEMWGQTGAGAIDASDRAALFRDGNYGMFIHWGLYSHLGGKWRGETFYGIGEWILRQMKIPVADYQAIAREFSPTDFDAREVVRLAKAAGMRYIIITAKHHDGFAMFKSAHPFNIVDATPFARDPMGELAAACREAGLGFGFYYSHFQDWTAPGGGGGPATYPDGTPASFETYFREKCLPQVREISTQYGPLNFVWFDTPNEMPKDLVLELAAVVEQTQPQAMVCSRIGHDLGDYTTQGDMEVPPRNLPGLWETPDTTNDSWCYMWYDENWKDARAILQRLVGVVSRGGTYLLNVGPDGSGRIPAVAADNLEKAGAWIARHQRVITAAGPSPWGHEQPWGDVTTQGDTLQLVVFDWPDDGRLLLPGLQTEIEAVAIATPAAQRSLPITWKREGSWTTLHLPHAMPDRPAAVINVTLRGPARVDETFGVAPNYATRLPVEFADITGGKKKRIGWMEKFGEWKHAVQIGGWTDATRATWTVDVAEPGRYHVELAYRGEGRLVWEIAIDEGQRLHNQQGATEKYQSYPIGLLTFSRPGRHTLTVALVGGKREQASLEAMILTPAH